MNNRDWPLKKRRSFYFVIQWNRLGEKSNYCRCVHFRFFFQFFSLSRFTGHCGSNGLVTFQVIRSSSSFFTLIFSMNVFFLVFFSSTSVSSVFFFGGVGALLVNGGNKRGTEFNRRPSAPPLLIFFPRSFVFFLFGSMCVLRGRGGVPLTPPPPNAPFLTTADE